MQRILVIKPCCLGDVLMATPVLRALHAAYPEAAIDVAVTSWAAPALEGHPAVRRIIPYPPSPNVRAVLRLARQLAKEHYDCGLGLDRSPYVALTLCASRIPVRAGINARGRGLLYTHRVRPRPGQHETELYLAVTAQLGIPPQEVEPEYFINERELTQMSQRLVDLPRPVVVLHPGGAFNPGSAFLAKRWPAERYAALATWLYETYHATLILLGAESDRPVTETVAKTTSAPAHDWTGQLSWPTLAALLKLADLFIGNDSGASHLAAAVGTPAVVIFGPTSPLHYRPLGRQIRVCAPTQSWLQLDARDLRRTSSHPAAVDIRHVSLEQVQHACKELLRNAGTSHHA